QPLTHIFNVSIESEIIPHSWKAAHVLPLHKDGPTNILNNYRPISKLPCLAKILEKLVSNQIKSFLIKHSVLKPYQSGFRQGHNYHTATTKVLNDIYAALDSRQECLALFIDLSKAFDSVNHQILLKQLQHIGFDKKAYNWFSNYLSNRTQAVVADGFKSEFLITDKGVPQGSILGPLLFTIFINSIGCNIKHSSIHLYADDAILYTSAPSAGQAAQFLQEDFDEIQKSLIKLKLSLNTRKTKYMLFSKRQEVQPLNIHTFDGTVIERVSSYKYLGFWLDEKLTFKTHVSKLCRSLKSKLSFYYRNKSCIPLNYRKEIVQATFLSVLDYGDTVYMHTSLSVLKPLDAVYHSAIRFITGDKYRTHHCLLYDKVGWSSLTNRREQHCILFIYKGLVGRLPDYLACELNYSSSSYNTRSHDCLVLKNGLVKSDTGKRGFSYYAAHKWNELQRLLQLNSLVPLSHLKRLIFDMYKENCTCFN
uniref:Reverse transcriptase domain-containing protein n=1 Tax=Neogobius melanostomus TaxID=47308 RepID=A0A8C6V4C6_9GOBI